MQGPAMLGRVVVHQTDDVQRMPWIMQQLAEQALTGLTGTDDQREASAPWADA